MTMLFNEYPTNTWIDCEFIDHETGEIFFVELRKEENETPDHFIARCQEIADDNFDDAKFIRLVEQEEAEILGYDTY